MPSKWDVDLIYNSEKQEPYYAWVMSHTTGRVMRLPPDWIVRDHGHAQRLPYKHLAHLISTGVGTFTSAETIIKRVSPLWDSWHINRYVCSRIVVVSDGLPSANDEGDGRPRCFWCIRVVLSHGKGRGAGSNFLWPLASSEAWRFYAALSADPDLGNGANASSLVTLWIPERHAEMEEAIVAQLQPEYSASRCTDRLFVAALSPSAYRVISANSAPDATLSNNAPTGTGRRRKKAPVSEGRGGSDHMASMPDDLHAYIWQFIVGGQDDGSAPLAPHTYVRAVDWRTRRFVLARIASWMNETARLCKAVACTSDLNCAYALRRHVTERTFLSAHACFFACLTIATAKQVRHVTDKELECVYEHLLRGEVESFMCAPVHLNVLTGFHSERERLNTGKELMTMLPCDTALSRTGTGMDTHSCAYRTRGAVTAQASWVPTVRLNLWVNKERVRESEMRGWRMWSSDVAFGGVLARSTWH